MTTIIDCLPGSECCKGACYATTCELDSGCTVFDPCVIRDSDDDSLGSGLNSVCCGSACRRPCPDGTLMGKGCECHVNGSTSLDGVVVRDDASG